MKIFFLCICVPLAITACYTPRYVYSPAAQNVPTLTKKGDINFTAYYSTSFAIKSKDATNNIKVKNSGADVQVAIAFNNHWAAQAAYFTRKETNDGNYQSITDSAVINYKRDAFDAGIGYFTPLPGRVNSYFQVFVGLGTGNYNFTDEGRNLNGFSYSRFHKAKALKCYFQPAIMLWPSKNYSTAFSSRFTLIKFQNIKTSYNFTELNNYKLDSIAVSSTIFWEPALTNNISFKHLPGIQIQMQAGFAFLLTRHFVDSRPFNFSLGLNAELQKIFKRKGKS
ncbi:MAG: hypothetical protein ABIW38_00560 [Ferruginibacter sp.]